jgi:hypothetical protein
MAIEETRQAASPTNTPRPFPRPTNLILGCTFAGTLLFLWVFGILLAVALPGNDNWARYLLAAILAAMSGTLAGVVIWARHVAEWARQVAEWARSVEAGQAEGTRQVSAPGAEVEQRISHRRGQPTA